MTEKERKERELRNIEELRMIDDTFFAAVFDGQTAETEVLIRTILNRDDITVVEAKVQNFIPNLRGHGVSLDILAMDSKGRAYNIEVQRASAGATPKRARFTGAMVDTRLLEKGEDYEDLPNRYTIFITEEDYYKRKEPVYHVENTIKELDNAPLGDGSYILYINGSYRNLETPIGRLMHDFSCADSSGIINPVLKKRIKYLKEEEGGHRSMCKLMDDLINDVVVDAVKDAVRDERIDTAKKLLALGDSSLSNIAIVSNLPLSTVEELASSMKKDPD